MWKENLKIFVVLGFTIILLTFVASCAPRQLSTSVIPEGGGSISPSSGEYSGKVTIVATPAANYEFKGWAGAASGNTNPLTITLNTDKHVIAEFKKKIYNIQVQIEPSNGGMVQPTSGEYEAGKKVNFIATPSAGYRFHSWSGGVTGSANPVDVNVDNNKTVIAKFVKQYMLSVICQPIDGGSVPSAGLQDEGTNIVLNAVPNFPYYPKVWIGTDTPTNPASVIMNSDKVVTIIFEPTIAGEAQSVEGSLSRGQYNTNESDSLIIQLKKYEWVQGEIVLGTNPPIAATIQNPNGTQIQNFGSSKQGSFSFMAETTGPYTVTFSTTSIFWSNYSFTYTIFRVP